MYGFLRLGRVLSKVASDERINPTGRHSPLGPSPTCVERRKRERPLLAPSGCSLPGFDAGRALRCVEFPAVVHAEKQVEP